MRKEAILKKIQTRIDEHALVIKDTQLFGVSYVDFFTDSKEVVFSKEKGKDFFYSKPFDFCCLGELLFENPENYDLEKFPYERINLDRLQLKYGVTRDALQKYTQKKKIFGSLLVEDVFSDREIVNEVVLNTHNYFPSFNPLTVDRHLQISKNSYQVVFQKTSEDTKEVAVAYLKLYLHTFWRFVIEIDTVNS